MARGRRSSRALHGQFHRFGQLHDEDRGCERELLRLDSQRHGADHGLSTGPRTMPDALSVPSGPARPAGAYQEHAPPASLAQHVECFWSRTGSGAATGVSRSHRVMPDGCADIVLAFDGGVPTAALAVGTMTRP